MNKELIEAYLQGVLTGRREMLAIILARFPSIVDRATFPVGEMIQQQLDAISGELHSIVERFGEMNIANAPATLQDDLKQIIARTIEEQEKKFRKPVLRISKQRKGKQDGRKNGRPINRSVNRRQKIR